MGDEDAEDAEDEEDEEDEEDVEDAELEEEPFFWASTGEASTAKAARVDKRLEARMLLGAFRLSRMDTKREYGRETNDDSMSAQAQSELSSRCDSKGGSVLLGGRWKSRACIIVASTSLLGQRLGMEFIAARCNECCEPRKNRRMRSKMRRNAIKGQRMTARPPKKKKGKKVLLGRSPTLTRVW